MADAAAKKRRLEALMGGGGEEGGGAPGAGPSFAGSGSGAGPSAPPPLAAFEASANEALTFRLVRTAAELDTAPAFHPEFTHQVFRENETIFGYRDLKIVITLHAVTFHALVEISHAGTAPSALGSVDNVEARLHEAFPAGFTTDRAAFLAQLAALGPSPALPAELTPLMGDAPDARSGARLLHAPLTSAAVRAWHARVAPFVLFFIDAGTHLDTEADPKWELLVAVAPPAGGAPAGGFVVAGFATVYRFYAWPQGCRLRLSQLLVFPPLQRRGVAAALLAGVRACALAAGAVDYAVEDPTDALQRLREVADLRAARAMPAVAAAAASAVAAAQAAPDAARRVAALELPADVAEALRAALRLCKPQGRLVWEGLLFLAARDARCDPQGAAAAAFREAVARRLRGPGGDTAKAAAERKFTVDREDAPPAEEDAAPQQGPGHFTPAFLMMRGANSGRAAVVLEEREEAAAAAAADAMRELMAGEMARLAKLAAAVP